MLEIKHKLLNQATGATFKPTINPKSAIKKSLSQKKLIEKLHSWGKRNEAKKEDLRKQENDLTIDKD